MFRKLLVAPVVTAAVLAGAALPSGATDAPPPTTRTITDLVARSGGEFDQNGQDFDLLLNAVVAAGLDDELAAPGSLTVFAPKDSAFVRLAKQLGFIGNDEGKAWTFLVDALTDLGGGDPLPVLTTVLTYHVHEGRMTALAVSQQPSVSTLAGIDIHPDGFALGDQDPDLLDPRMVVPGTNLNAANGVVHTLNRVLVPVDL
jgi:uncharacterized surface protein with fasciclin (FAS1) repeats